VKVISLRALVVDFDGTLTEGGPPAPSILADLVRFRAAGNRVVIATGRILDELLTVFPEVLRVADVVVAENGAMLATGEGVQRLAAPVSMDLDASLRERGVEFRRGQVLVACQADAANAVLESVHDLGLDAQLVFNRSELMVLPAGVSKGSGAAAALASLGLSPHNAVAIGDAENDHSLLALCELAVAPANAVEALKVHADLVLDQRDGAAVSELISRVLDGESLPASSRWAITVGTDPQGTPVTLPVSEVNLLVAGNARSGKSYLAGLIAEQLVGLGYETLVIDPEGDHVGLRQLPGVTWFGGPDLPHDPGRLAEILGSPMGSVVVDLSHLGLDARIRWMEGLPEVVASERERSGSPQWVIIDEAHLVANDSRRVARFFARRWGQYCFVTFLPDLLDPTIFDHLDLITVSGSAVGLPDGFAERVAAVADVHPGGIVEELLEAAPGTALVVRREPKGLTRCRIAGRHTGHLRHWHKYAVEPVPAHEFHFRSSNHHRTGTTAASLAEFHAYLSGCDRSVIAHHAGHGDFSRWIHDTIADPVLADQVRASEQSIATGTPPDQAREAILDAIRARYLTS